MAPNERTPLLIDSFVKPTICTGSLILATFIPCLGGLLYGYDQTVMETIQTLPNFQSHFYHEKQPTLTNPLNYLSIGYFSMTILGSLSGGYVCDQAGRKPSLIGALLLFAMGTLFNIGCQHAWLFLLGRLLVGFGTGWMTVASPCLLTELAPADLRGCLVGFFTLLAMAGKLSGYYMMLEMGPSLSTESSSSSRDGNSLWVYDWQLAVGLETCLCLLLTLFQWHLPDSPRWLAHQPDRKGEGLKVIAYLHEQSIDDRDVQQLWKRISNVNNNDDDRSLGYVGWISSWTGEQQRRWTVVVGVILANQMTGCDTLLNYYASAIFYASGLQETNPFVANGCTQSLALVAMAISLGWIVDYFGRKGMLLVGSLVIAMCHLGLAGVFQCFSVVDWQTGSVMLMDANARMVAVACVYIFIIVYAFTWGSLILPTSCELFSTADRAKGIALMACLAWCVQYLLTIPSLWCFSISPSLVYFIYGFSMLGSAGFVYCCVPNTTKKTLEEIADMVF